MNTSRELIVVMPVYNEAECISAVLNDWSAALADLNIDFEILVLNDGSNDNTAQVLSAYEDDARVTVINKANSGHGPTILQGYREAVQRADWVFQIDSDDEMKPRAFPNFWKRREKYDAIFGVRVAREQDSARRFLSAGSRATIKFLYSRGVRDVNVPYRLMRARTLSPIVAAIPDTTFAPNILISGVLGKRRRRVLNFPVLHENRVTGTGSLANSKIWKIAARALAETLRFRMP